MKLITESNGNQLHCGWSSIKYYNFQQRMSRLPQRWRTQRNAIRNANCKTSWIIKTLNAHCASGKCPVAYLSECPRTPLSAEHSLLFCCWFMSVACSLRPFRMSLDGVSVILWTWAWLSPVNFGGGLGGSNSGRMWQRLSNLELRVVILSSLLVLCALEEVFLLLE